MGVVYDRFYIRVHLRIQLLELYFEDLFEMGFYTASDQAYMGFSIIIKRFFPKISEFLLDPEAAPDQRETP